MSLSLTIPQIFYDLIARVLPGFLFLLGLRASLAGTELAPTTIVGIQSDTSMGNVLAGLGFLAICYFAGWFLRGIRWPNQQPDESTEFRTMYQRLRLRHPESGFRVVKLRAEARLLEASRCGMFIVCGMAVAAWSLRTTNLVAGESVPQYMWIMRIAFPALIGIVFYNREREAWETYRGNVEKLHSLIIDEECLKASSPGQKCVAEQTDTGAEGRRSH